jgi:hypothetical protein
MSLTITDKANPYPLIGDTVTIRLRNLKNADGAAYDISGAAKIYCIIKTALTDLDAAALVNINNGTNSTQFVTTYASTGNIDVTLSSTNTAALTADTTYYIDVKAIWTTGTVIVSLLYDTIIFRQRVTRATS